MAVAQPGIARSSWSVPMQMYQATCKAGLFSSIFWEQGFDKVRESSGTLELFEQFDVQLWKWRYLLVSMVILDQNMLVLAYMYIINYN
jgi:hypothetical protein